jgi:type IV pilus assembly protein PilB
MASKKEKEVLGKDPEKNLEIYYAKGCSACNNTGYQGRIAVHEVLKIDKTLRKKIIAEAGFDEMFKYAKSQGMETLSENVIALILEGVTSLSEGAQIVYHSIGED